MLTVLVVASLALYGVVAFAYGVWVERQRSNRTCPTDMEMLRMNYQRWINTAIGNGETESVELLRNQSARKDTVWCTFSVIGRAEGEDE